MRFVPFLVMVEAQRLLARVALRRRVGLVAADALEAPGWADRDGGIPVAEADLDAAVALAQDACGGLPVSLLGGLLGGRRAKFSGHNVSDC